MRLSESEKNGQVTGHGYGYGYYGQYGYGASPNDGAGAFDLHRISRLTRLYWRFLALVTLLVLAGGALFTFAIPDRYTAETRLLVLSDQVSIINLDAVTTGVASDMTGLLSEIEMVGSLEVTQQVLGDIGLDGQLRMITVAQQANSFQERYSAVVQRLARLFEAPLRAVAREAPDEVEVDPRALVATLPGNESTWLQDMPANQSLLSVLRPEGVYRAAAEMLASSLQVEQVGRSRVISITVTAPVPRLAADIANRLADSYINAQVKAKFEAARLANELLNEQLTDLRQQISAQEREIETYRLRSGLTNSDAVLLAAERVQQLDETLTSAQTRLAAIQARKQEAESVRANRSLIEATADVIGSDFVGSLREREVELERTVSTLEDRLLPNHPDLIRARNDLEQLRGRISGEIEKIVQSISSEENTLRAEIAVLQETLAHASAEMLALNKAEREIEALTTELQVNRSLVETFVARSRETEVQENFQQADAQVIAKAQTPILPSGPNRRILLALSLLAAFGVGGSAVVLREIANPRNRSIEGVRKITQAPLLGILPDVRRFGGRNSDVATMVRDDPSARISDLMRRIYLKLVSARNLSRPNDEGSFQGESSSSGARVILVTSSRPGEGKTSLACSLAFTARRFKKRVIVIDGDLRKPTIARTLGVNHDAGIVDYLQGSAGVDEVVNGDRSTGVQYILRGSRAKDPAELVELRRTRQLIDALRDIYDLVIIDSAPVLAAPETRQLARAADQVIFVVNWSITRRDEFASAINEIADTPHFTERSCLILNQVPAAEMRFLDLPHENYFAYYRYRNYGNDK